MVYDVDRSWQRRELWRLPWGCTNFGLTLMLIKEVDPLDIWSFFLLFGSNWHLDGYCWSLSHLRLIYPIIHNTMHVLTKLPTMESCRDDAEKVDRKTTCRNVEILYCIYQVDVTSKGLGSTMREIFIAGRCTNNVTIHDLTYILLVFSEPTVLTCFC